MNTTARIKHYIRKNDGSMLWIESIEVANVTCTKHHMSSTLQPECVEDELFIPIFLTDLFNGIVCALLQCHQMLILLSCS